ncbi:hypothetical protein D018_0571A, partial [Vibrio parahaemolyticus VP2007-007]
MLLVCAFLTNDSYDD